MDWKESLSSLRGYMTDGNEGENHTVSNEELTDPFETKKIQKEPVRVITDKKGRNGKTATIIEGFTIDQGEVEKIARSLKQKLGVGGSVREGEILVQGNHKEAVVEFLKSLSFKTKK